MSAHDLENGSNAIPTETPARDPIQASSIETGSVVEVYIYAVNFHWIYFVPVMHLIFWLVLVSTPVTS